MVNRRNQGQKRGHWLGRTAKSYVRDQLFTKQKHRRARCVLLLPGVDLLCLRLLLDMRIVNKQTMFHLFEFDKEAADVVLAEFEKLGLKGYVYNMAVEDVDLKAEFADVKFDLVYLDWSIITAKRLKFVRELRKYMTSGAMFAASSYHSRRSHHLFRKITEPGNFPKRPYEHYKQRVLAGYGGVIASLEILGKQAYSHLTFDSVALYGMALGCDLNVHATYAYSDRILERKKGGLVFTTFSATLGKRKKFKETEVVFKLADSM